MAEPSEESIAEVCEFASLDPVGDRSMVIAALKALGSVQDVVLNYYDDASKFRQQYTWDETSFAGDRDGFNNSPLPSFSVQGPDDHGSSGSIPIIHGVSASGYHGVAPSRPPSRAQSPLSKMADWTAHDAGAPMSLAQEDKDLERALAESAAMSGLHTPHTPQETGITGYEDPYGVSLIGPPREPPPSASTSLPFFGPAHRDAYDPDQWAMVRRTPDVQEPGPSGRKRAPDTPAFLRARRTGNEATTMGPLLTILHAIPAARNTFLAAGDQPASYGQSPEWWKGERIEPVGLPALGESVETSIALDADSDPDDSYEIPSSDSPKARELLDEIHRLMAFLDATDRAYGTADLVADSQLVQQSYGNDASQKLFEAFRGLALPGVMETFFSNVQLRMLSKLREEPTRNETFALLEIKVDPPYGPYGARDLYGAMDLLYWEDLYKYSPHERDVSAENASMAALSRLAPVQIFQLRATGPVQQPLDVPAVMYADRYLDAHKGLASELQINLQKAYAGLRKIGRAEAKLTTFYDYSTPDEPPVARDMMILSEQGINFAVQKNWQYKCQVAWDEYQKGMLDVVRGANEVQDLRVKAWAAEKQAKAATKAREAVDVAAATGPEGSVESIKQAEMEAIQAAEAAEAELAAAIEAHKHNMAEHTRHQFDFSVADIDALAPSTPEQEAMKGVFLAEAAVHRDKLIKTKKKQLTLEAQREAILETVHRYRKLYTEPSAKDNWNPKHRYSLRGVIVSADRFYFCRREAPAPTEIDDAPEVGAPEVQHVEGGLEDHDAPAGAVQDKGKEQAGEEPGFAAAAVGPGPNSLTTVEKVDQWWAVSYNPQSANPINVVKTTVDIARAAVFQESTVCTIVYASDEALDEEEETLSAALRTFVRFDNRLFKQELSEESPRGEKKRQPAEEASPVSPLKRQQRQRSASMDSMASNRASLGGEDSDRDFGGTLFGDGDSVDREMEDVPLLNRMNSTNSMNSDRFPLDTEDGSSFYQSRVRYNSREIHDWTARQPSAADELDALNAAGSFKGYMGDGHSRAQADEVRPQREVDFSSSYEQEREYYTGFSEAEPPNHALVDEAIGQTLPDLSKAPSKEREVWMAEEEQSGRPSIPESVPQPEMVQLPVNGAATTGTNASSSYGTL